MNENMIQGKMLGYVRSNKYRNIRCYAILITAKCDLVQEKVVNVHCLVALDLNDWIDHVLSLRLIELYKKEKVYIPLKKIVEDSGMDYETWSGFSSENMKKVCKEKCKEKVYNQIEGILNIENEIQMIIDENSSEKRMTFLKKNYQKKLYQECLNIYGGKDYKYCFLPRQSYSDCSNLLDGVVVDLQDIMTIRLQDCKKILQNQYDFMIIQDEKERERINNTFFFESPDDFVIFLGCIKSPWIEYLMQKFAFSFIRIGVLTAERTNIEAHITNLMEGYENV